VRAFYAIFFFSSRRRHTRCLSDWSSDVCSSDLIVYWGAHSTPERDKRIRAFHDDERSVLIASRAGSEGRNLQFCNVLVNYDLPWNPMVVEQRIGRLHRIGQTREVHIVNLAAAGTIESHILQLLDQKIKLFELVVGELDLILGEFGGAQQFEGRLAKE